MDNFRRLLRELLRPLQASISALATRVTLTAVDDTKRIQTVQVTGRAGERLSDVQRLQQFGFSANPPLGSNGLMICIAGSRSHPVVIACDDGSTRVLELEPGEACVYNAFGDFVRLKTSGEMVVKAREKVTVDAPLTHALGDAEVDGDALVHGDAQIEGNGTVLGDLAVSGNLTVGGTIDATGAISSDTSVADPTGTLAALRTAYNAHAHGGVDTGSGTSGGTTEPA